MNQLQEWTGKCQRCFIESEVFTMSIVDVALICFRCRDAEVAKREEKRMKHNVLILVLMIGVVDSVASGVARVELSSSNEDTIDAYIPVKLFPCIVEEGDIFSIDIADGVTEIRCGDPDI